MSAAQGTAERSLSTGQGKWWNGEPRTRRVVDADGLETELLRVEEAIDVELRQTCALHYERDVRPPTDQHCAVTVQSDVRFGARHRIHSRTNQPPHNPQPTQPTQPTQHTQRPRRIDARRRRRLRTHYLARK
jgi:hypothetical protein